MFAPDATESVRFGIRHFRVHILVFLFVLFVSLTFAHPVILLNDEWITTNQLHQLYEGHQVIVNEGKYGFNDNGTMNVYFATRSNVLGYSLFLSLLALPSLWLIHLFREHFVFFILYLWTGIALLLFLSVHLVYREYRTLGTWRWTPTVIAVFFLVFFLNLANYMPFPVSGTEAFPEIMAVVFTNTILLALAGVLIYEMNRTLFYDTPFSLFGTAVCLSSSSYFFWVTGCKDHILILVLFAGVLLSLIKFLKTSDIWYLCLAFLITGLLAWARPELAIWVFFLDLCLWIFSLKGQLQQEFKNRRIPIIASPLFTLLGALPFLLNNYLVTKNPLLPVGIIYLSKESAMAVVQTVAPLQQPGTIPEGSLLKILTILLPAPSPSLFGDLFGILFLPQNGSMGLIPLTPFFCAMACIAVIQVLTCRFRFSDEDKAVILLLALTAVFVFLAYSHNLLQLNTSMGITPDIRYLSPLYVPLTLIGLVLFRKIPNLNENPVDILKNMLFLGVLGIPASLVLMSYLYTNPSVASELNSPLSVSFTLILLTLVVITVLTISSMCLFDHRIAGVSVIIAMLCIVPLIWQIDMSVYVWQFATAEGYPAWIPVIRIFYMLCSLPLIMQLPNVTQ